MGPELFGAAAGIISNWAQTLYNNDQAAYRTMLDRSTNYKYNEMAAENADKRTRALYNDIYSPQALMRQYKQAGLSPSLMFGGTPGQGGMSGAQGAGPAGPQTPIFGVNALEGAQIANIIAQTEKTKAETANINKDTDIKVLQEEWQNMINGEKFPEVRIFGSYSTDGISLYDKADDYKTFEEFKKWYENEHGGQINEYERRALQKIYTATYYLDREVATLTNETVAAEFYTNITNQLEKENFADWNAQSTVAYLKQNVQTNKLDEQQKRAWNNLLDRVGKKSETAKDVLLIIGMILDKALTQYRLPSIETGGKTININKGDTK